MRLPYVIVTLAMLASVSTAQAIPNMWTSGFGMGVTEYIITSPDKVVFNLNCTGNPDAQNILWICPYISRHLLSLNPLQARCRRYSRGER